MEIFVGESDLPTAMAFIRASIEYFADIQIAFPSEFLATIRDAGLADRFAAARGSYVHNYPLFCRRVLADDTLISVTGPASGPMFTISIFSYDRPRRREAYYEFCRFLAFALRQLVDAKLHWGKHFPFEYSDISALYPQLENFRAICLGHDPDGVLRNGYTARVLDLCRGPRPDHRDA